MILILHLGGLTKSPPPSETGQDAVHDSHPRCKGACSASKKPKAAGAGGAKLAGLAAASPNAVCLRRCTWSSRRVANGLVKAGQQAGAAHKRATNAPG